MINYFSANFKKILLNFRIPLFAVSIVYLLLSLVGYDSGLALDAGLFLKTRFFAWDDRLDFGRVMFLS